MLFDGVSWGMENRGEASQNNSLPRLAPHIIVRVRSTSELGQLPDPLDTTLNIQQLQWNLETLQYLLVLAHTIGYLYYV
jgi:hypothetical protein